MSVLSHHRRRVGIVGGGASGALVAVRLLAQAVNALDVVIFEPRQDLALGVAYSTTNPQHLLNVPAGNMSAFAEDPDHFRAWASCGSTDFVSRAAYGRYLQEVLADAVARSTAGSTVTHVRQVVVDIEARDPRESIRIQADDGSVHEVDAVVLATGHDEPQMPAVLESLPPSLLVRDPWSSEALEDLPAHARVLVVGTGLTFVDVALTVLSKRSDTRIEAVSRRGLAPIAHEDPWRPRHDTPTLPDWSIPSIVRYLRSFGGDWRRGVDSLRPITADVWLQMSDEEKESFTRHLARYWDIHRHRVAPQVAHLLDDLGLEGRIVLHAAHVQRASVWGERARVELSTGVVLEADRVVVCTGPSGDMASNDLGRVLIARGTAQPGPLGIGYLVDPNSGALIDVAGRVSEGLLTIGPLRRGVLWESIAMPELRVQAADVAERVLRHLDRLSTSRANEALSETNSSVG